MKVRVVIERKDLFDITREKERDEADSKRTVIKKDGAERDMG